MNQKEENYQRFSKGPDRIDGSVHNRVVARLGTAFDYGEMEPLDVVEMAFTVEPHGNIRSMMVVDMAAAKSLRDQLDAAIKEHDANVRRARRHRHPRYQVPDGKGGTKNVTIPED